MSAVNVKAKEASEDKDGFHKFYYTTLFDRSSVTAAKGDDMTPLALDPTEPYISTLSHC